MISVMSSCYLFGVILQAWVAISSKSPVMVLQEHPSLQMLAATVVMPQMLTKQVMDQVPMELERILDEGPPMLLVDSIHTDARELWRRFIQKCICSALIKLQNCLSFLAFQEILDNVSTVASFNLFAFVIFCFSSNSRRRGKLLYAGLPS